MHLASVALLACLGSAAATDGREVSHSNARGQLSYKAYSREVRLMESEHEANVKHFEQTMNFNSSMELFRKTGDKSKSLVATVEQALHSHEVGKVATHKFLNKDGSDPETGYGAVEKAVTMLNDMITEVNQDHDKLTEDCKSQFQIYCTDMEGCRSRIAVANQEAAEARACLLRQQKVINVEERNLPSFRKELFDTESTCKRQIAEMEELLRTVLADIGVMASVLKMTACESDFLLFSQMPTQTCDCHGKKVIKLASEGLHSNISMIQDGKLKGQVMAALNSFSQEEPVEGMGEPIVTKFENPPLHQEPIPGNPCNGLDFRGPPSTDRGCKIDRQGANCWKLQDRFLLIQGGIVDERDKLLLNIAQTTKRCAENIALLRQMIEASEMQLDSANQKLAECTATENTAAEQGRQEGREHHNLEVDMLSVRMNCSDQLSNMESEKCGLGKIRGEIAKLQGKEGDFFFKDCEQSEWEEGECSESCGGGMMKLTRAVLGQPFKGAACGPTFMLQTCNPDSCPVDCELYDWSGWSGCSADCGGGVKQRNRETKTQPQYDGEPCGETSQTESCSMSACDKDCVMADWGVWSDCSKNCEGGTTFRSRRIDQEAVGGGSCPAEHAIERFNELPCNTGGCMKDNASEPLKCHAAVDVVLILDGSTSIGEDGWEATKQFAKTFVSAFKDDGSAAEISLILFSGPTTWDDYSTCTGDVPVDSSFMESKCGIKVVQHFDADMGKTESAVDGLVWPKGTTLTQSAIGSATSELMMGRTDAPTVIVLVTDGRPISTFRTNSAAEALKAKGARLLVVPVGGKGLDDEGLASLSALVSFPPQDNLVSIESFQKLLEIESVDRIVADMCPESPCAKFCGKTNLQGYCADADGATGYYKMANQAFSGGEDKGKTGNAAACSAMCDEKSGCVGFTRNKATGQCYLGTGAGQSTSADDSYQKCQTQNEFCFKLADQKKCDESYLWMIGDGLTKPCHWNGASCNTHQTGADWTHCAAAPQHHCPTPAPTES